jgi:hypothetical protein
LMNTTTKPTEMSNNKLEWSKLTKEQKEQLLKGISEILIDCLNERRKIHKKYMEDLYYELFTPFYIKWWHKVIKLRRR